jgi:hypothetical protein
VDLWPLVQAVPPAHDAEAELFLFDGHGHHGALLIAAPSGLERHDSVARDCVAMHVIAIPHQRRSVPARADGDRAAIARGKTVEIYELPGGQLLRTIRHPATVNAVAFAITGHDAAGFLPDGRVVAADARCRLRAYDTDRGAVRSGSCRRTSPMYWGSLSRVTTS